MDFLGADVALTGVAGEPVVVRANYYPAWRAWDGDREVPLHRVPVSWRSALPGTAVTRFASSTSAIAACRSFASSPWSVERSHWPAGRVGRDCRRAHDGVRPAGAWGDRHMLLGGLVGLTFAFPTFDVRFLAGTGPRWEHPTAGHGGGPGVHLLLLERRLAPAAVRPTCHGLSGGRQRRLQQRECHRRARVEDHRVADRAEDPPLRSMGRAVRRAVAGGVRRPPGTPSLATARCWPRRRSSTIVCRCRSYHPPGAFRLAEPLPAHLGAVRVRRSGCRPHASMGRDDAGRARPAREPLFLRDGHGDARGRDEHCVVRGSAQVSAASYGVADRASRPRGPVHHRLRDIAGQRPTWPAQGLEPLRGIRPP